MNLEKESFVDLEKVLSESELSDEFLLHLDKYPKCHIVSKQDTILKRHLKTAVNNQPVPDSLENSIREFIQK